MHWTETDRLILPEENRWGQGYGGKPYTVSELNEIVENVAGTPQPGYGPRYHSENADAYQWEGRMVLPPGYDATAHPNWAAMSPGTMDEDRPTDPGEPTWRVPRNLQAFFGSRGWLLDQHGRPCTPHAGQLVGHPRIGLNTGIGFGYYLGENIVADMVLVVDDKVLLVERATGAGMIPGLPGGYLQPTYLDISPREWLAGKRPVTLEGIINTARRKLLAETGVFLHVGMDMDIVRGIRPVSSPHTLNFWTVTYTVRCVLGSGHGVTPDTPGSRLVPIHELEAVMPRMWPDHRRALIAALG